jgi:hypothetical protein
MADLTPDPIVDILIRDGKLPKLTVLHGYLGTAPDENVRLYRIPALDSYIEIPIVEIEHSEKVTGWGSTLLWIRATLALNVVGDAGIAGPFPAAYLSGPIAEDLMREMPAVEVVAGEFTAACLSGYCPSPRHQVRMPWEEIQQG